MVATPFSYKAGFPKKIKIRPKKPNSSWLLEETSGRQEA